MKRILAIDDDRWVLETLKDALTERGYEVFTADCADDALRILEDNEISLVLLNLNVPGKNGFSVYSELEASKHVPVLFVSACPRSFSAASEEIVYLYEARDIRHQHE